MVLAGSARFKVQDMGTAVIAPWAKNASFLRQVFFSDVFCVCCSCEKNVCDFWKVFVLMIFCHHRGG